MASAKDILERVVASVPLSSTAARVMGSGEHYEPNVVYGSYEHHKIQPPIKPIPPLARPTCGDLPGRKFGRFTVIGLAAIQGPNGEKARKNSNARWVVRCACGAYEFRTAKAIRSPTNTYDRCQDCRHLDKIRARYEQLGPRAVEEFSQGKRG